MSNNNEIISLGIIRLDYDYPPAVGDIDHYDTFNYKVYYKVIPGLTFEMCQSGNITHKVKNNIINSVKWFNLKHVSAITGDCGFMINIQNIVREHTRLPVLMSSLVQLPTLVQSYGNKEKILVLTANGKSLLDMKGLIYDLCNSDIENEQIVIFGCENIKGFDAVAKGEKVNTQIVEKDLVEQIKWLLTFNSEIVCILSECTELPPYSDALRKSTGLPVFDAITCADFFMSSKKDNPRFGLNNWQNQWNGEQEKYNFGDNLDEAEKKDLINTPECINDQILPDVVKHDTIRHSELVNETSINNIIPHCLNDYFFNLKNRMGS